jgi:hypothetical protein
MRRHRGPVGDHSGRIADAAVLFGLCPRAANTELLGDVEASRQRVFVEAVPAVAAAEVGVSRALDAVEIPLCADGGGIVRRVLERESGVRCRRYRDTAGVHRDEKRCDVRQVLQPVHPVGDADVAVVAAAVGDIVPARPHIPSTRHQTRILMKPDLVRGIGEAREQVPLGGVGIGEQTQRLVCVAGKDNPVEAVPVARRVADLDGAVGEAADQPRRRRQSRTGAERRHDTLHVGAAPAAHGPPAKLRSDRQQPVIVEETHEGLRRIVEHASKRRRPDAGGHRHEIAVAEGRAEPCSLDEVPDREVEVLGPVEETRCHAVETQDVVRHAQERGPDEIAPLRKIALERAAILETTLVEADGERHVGLFRRHAEMVEQRHEVGIVALVVDDEADVDRRPAARCLGFGRAGMAAEATFALVDHDVVLAAEKPGGAHAGYAGADDGDFHWLNVP